MIVVVSILSSHMDYILSFLIDATSRNWATKIGGFFAILGIALGLVTNTFFARRRDQEELAKLALLETRKGLSERDKKHQRYYKGNVHIRTFCRVITLVGVVAIVIGLFLDKT